MQSKRVHKIWAFVFVLCLSGCANGPLKQFGDVDMSASAVPMESILARPELYDGKPVRVIGVADFDFGFEGESAIFPSTENLAHHTFSGIGVGSLGPGVKGSERGLEQLTGKFVLVEGIFHKSVQEPGSICLRGCWPAGIISPLTRVAEWF
jgi:hypothetical protein